MTHDRWGRLAAAIHWYERGEISQEKAARVAGLDRADCLAALGKSFRRYSDHLLSFVELHKLAVMERLGITYAFAFDSQFDEYPGLVKGPQWK